MMTEKRLSREFSGGSVNLQKKVVESRRKNKSDKAPDITDFMNDMFFGTLTNEKKAYNLTGNGWDNDDEEEAGFDDSTRSNSSRLTQEWLEEAKRMMASSPTRCESPTRLVGSPRFAGGVPARLSTSSVLDRRDPLSRSARRHRGVEGFSGEILIKSAKHSRNKSESIDSLPLEPSPASQFQQWFSNILTPPTNVDVNHNTNKLIDLTDPVSPTVPPRPSTYRRSRFQTEPPAPVPQGIPVPSRRTFKPAPLPDIHLLSPPKNLIESPQRRSISSSTCAQLEHGPLSPPRNLVESAHRRSLSRSTCSIKEKISPKPDTITKGWQKEENQCDRDINLNGFLKEQRIKIEKILNGEISSKAKVILSGPSNSTSSMIAAICYAWLLENKMMKNKGEGNGQEYVVVPVMNVRRGRMWKQRQAAWLFHHLGFDAVSLLFADEVDLENLIMSGKLSILVVGQDILKNDTEETSQCTILTDNYCEDAYHLLQTPLLKKLLLAGILLDTLNLNACTKMSMTRDAEAVQLLLIGSSPNYRNTLFDQLTQDQKDKSFFEALRYNYGKPPSESGGDSLSQIENRVSERRSSSASQNQAHLQNSDQNPKHVKNAKTNVDTQKPKPEAASDNTRGKNKFFLAKWFGFGK
ncbi:uncharacterized protein LOC126675439 isoform X2 [Mercurialis annua]|uniref:uncharacterized protein LOC126675439 isoform X2 n=1 Tax=Mercurialis annua TaxID=3986 RepID=UPI00215FEAA4|nr:uncharacterized protein LOC126675439 isoform X2 [Mercurialis annua]